MASFSISPKGISFTADDGTVVADDEAIAAFNAHIDAQQEQRQRFAREHPREWAEFCHAKGYVDAPPLLAPPRASSPQGRAPRAAQNTRGRGSRRGDRARSSSSDDPDPDPEPRVCECGCGAPLEHKNADASFLDDAHRARAWRRDQAERKLVRSDAQLALAAPRAVRSCVCGGATFDDPEGDPVCASCGRFVDPSHLASPNGWDARLAEFAYLATHRWDGDAWVRVYEHRDRVDPPGNDGGLQTRLLGERRRRAFDDRAYRVPPARSGGLTHNAGAGDSRRPQKGENHQ